MPQSHSEPRRARRRLRPRRVMLIVLGSLLAVIVVAVAWVGVRAFAAKNELEAAVPLATRLQSQVLAGNSNAAKTTFRLLEKHASSAAGYTSDPVWRGFEAVPWVGPNLTAVRQLSTIVSDLTEHGLKPLTTIAGRLTLGDFKPVGGVVDVAPLVKVQPQIARASAAFAAAARAAKAVESRDTIAAVKDATTRLRATVSTASEAADSVNRAVQLIPAMLGVAGPRNYLVLFQNPAELRSTGGIAGALALVHTENGKIELTQQAAGSDFAHSEESVLPLPLETRGLYGDITGEYMQDVNLTPNFPQSAKLAREMWRLKFGVEADGILSIDPVALSYLLKATGPITLPTGDILKSDTAVKLLLSDVYSRYTRPADQDRFFAAAAASVFGAVSGGKLDPTALVKALAKAGDEHRILLWSAHAKDQAILADTTLSGGLPVSDAKHVRFGVYLNDGTGAKMGYYLQAKTAIAQANCRKDGRASYAIDLTLTNTAPADAAKSLKPYVTGGGAFGVAEGNVRTIVAVYGPKNVQALTVLQDGKPAVFQPAIDDWYPVNRLATELAPGQSTTLRFNWQGMNPGNTTGSIVTTPMIRIPETSRGRLSCKLGLH
jgi:hypothetical protein